MVVWVRAALLIGAGSGSQGAVLTGHLGRRPGGRRGTGYRADRSPSCIGVYCWAACRAASSCSADGAARDSCCRR